MGVYLSTPNKSKNSIDGNNSYIRYGVSSMQGWRTGMEDAHSVILEEDGTSFVAVFDGHGGKEVAAFCARHMWDELKNSDQFKAGDISGAIKYAFLRLDELLGANAAQLELRAILAEEETQESNNKEEKNELYSLPPLSPRSETTLLPVSNAGCTSVVAVIKGNKLWVGNAGDSRAVLCRNGEAIPMSFDHKPNDTIEKQRIESAGGYVMNGRVNGNLNLSRAIGDLEFKNNPSLRPEAQIITANPDVIEETLTSADEFLILACDGIWDVKTNQTAVDFVRQRIHTTPRLSLLMEELLDDCLAPNTDPPGIGCDNMTAIVVVFQPKDSQQPEASL